MVQYVIIIKYGKIVFLYDGNFYAVNEDNWDALFFATYYNHIDNHIEIVKFLLKNA